MTRCAALCAVLFFAGGCAPTGSVATPTPTESVTGDSPHQTTAENRFVVPAGWTVRVEGHATIVTAPEGDSHIALVDLEAKDADEAVSAAWRIYDPQANWSLVNTTDAADDNGWTKRRSYSYDVPPNLKRQVAAEARWANDLWTVVIYDMNQAVAEKRLAQVALLFDELLPRGYERESFANKKAHPLTPERRAELERWVEESRKKLKIVGVSVGIVENGKVVLAKGFGEKTLGGGEAPDADTMYMVASNTKAMTTLMLAKLVDQGKFGWETKAKSLLPSFKLGSPETTDKVLVEHLICACTGMPRQDFEWLMEFEGVTPADALEVLGTMQPTSDFGELFQYSNPMAAAAGFIGGHVTYPDREFGAAYDEAMRTLVFEPLGMTATTFDYAKAQSSNYTAPYAPDINDEPAQAAMDVNYSVIPVRPAGAAWSNVTDMLKYIQFELDAGVLPNGERYLARETLLERRKPFVTIGKHATYGMGLQVDNEWDVEVVHHGGDMIGYHSDMMWLPKHGVGAVILTNSNPGWTLRDLFRRKLLEVLFDGKPEAEGKLDAAADSFFSSRAAQRKLLSIPADPEQAAALATEYYSDALGEVKVKRDGERVTFDFGEWQADVASKANPDGTVSFVTITPGIDGAELVVGPKGDGARTLVFRDAQHEYVFEEVMSGATSRR